MIASNQQHGKLDLMQEISKRTHEFLQKFRKKRFERHP